MTANLAEFVTIQRKKTGGKALALSGLYKMFSNRFYAGVIEWEGRTYDGKHPPLVTLAEFDRAQVILGRPGRPRPRIRRFAYTGLIRCGECGLSVTAEEKVNRYGTHYTYYHCTKRRLEYDCHQPVIEVRELETQVLAFLEDLVLSERFRRWTLARIVRMEAEGVSQRGARKRVSADGLASVRMQLENLTRLRLRDLVSDEEFVRERSTLDAERQRLAVAVQEAERARPWFEPARMLLEFSSVAAPAFRDGDADTKRFILETVGSNLLLTGRRFSGDAKKPFRRRSDATKVPQVCPREESNLNCKIRNLASYPLNDKGF